MPGLACNGIEVRKNQLNGQLEGKIHAPERKPVGQETLFNAHEHASAVSHGPFKERNHRSEEGGLKTKLRGGAKQKVALHIPPAVMKFIEPILG